MESSLIGDFQVKLANASRDLDEEFVDSYFAMIHTVFGCEMGADGI